MRAGEQRRGWGHKNPPAQDESILALPSSLNSFMSSSVGSVYMCFSKWPRQQSEMFFLQTITFEWMEKLLSEVKLVFVVLC